jgi:DNA repair protein RecN (Recombination protein N)
MMLTNLHVKNLALIEEADVSFTEGLNILSGETGAGKSILIGSINTALGGKAARDMIRAGKDSALIELIFQLEDDETIEKIREAGFEPEDGQIIISRKIFENKSVSRINGETVSLGQLKDITSLLIDIHGQHEHQSLLKKSHHIEILDEFAKKDAAALRAGIAEEYHRYTRLKKEYDSMNLDEEGRRRELNFIEFEINEIEAAALRADEEDELMTEFRKLSNGKHILNGLSDIYTLVGYESADGAGEKLEKAVKTMLTIAEYDPELGDLKDQILDLEAQLGDFANAIRIYRENLSLDEEALETVQNRLDLLHEMKRKYGRTIEDVLKHLSESRKRRDELLEYDAHKNALEQELLSLNQKLLSDCEKLTGIRKKNAQILEQEITHALADLHFMEVRFKISFGILPQPTAGGMDDVEFLISTNPGEEPKPLGRVASGGELSRIMLAIKTVLARLDSIDTLIFDEIDTGISGITASCVAAKLHEISTVRQVICISHLAQIVAMADTHFLIEKHAEQGKTITEIKPLNEDESVRELARILGGANITATTLESARELKNSKN